MSYIGIHACGSRSAGLFARTSETPVDEAGTEHVSDNGVALEVSYDY